LGIDRSESVREASGTAGGGSLAKTEQLVFIGTKDESSPSVQCKLDAVENRSRLAIGHFGSGIFNDLDAGWKVVAQLLDQVSFAVAGVACKDQGMGSLHLVHDEPVEVGFDVKTFQVLR